VTSPENKQELLDFQARWMRPAGIAAILAAGLLFAAGIVGSVGSSDTTAEQLDRYHDHSSRLVFASVISAVGLVLIACPLYFLFLSARARADRVRSFVGPLILLGTLLVAAQGVVVALGLKDASADYVAGVAAVEAKARNAAPATPQNATTTTTTGGETTGSTTAPSQPTLEQRISDAKDNFAEDKVDDSSKVGAGRIIGLIGALTLIASAVYTLVWSMRTGLLTRFMGTVGIAFIAALILIPQLGPLATVLWFAVLGLMLARWWPRALPPAWDAGEAIPWPGREDIGPPPEERGGAGTVEGTGREISERQLPENGGPGEAPPEPGESQGQRRKKRKRRN
jgi:uncharacterized membrane protein YqhA